MPLPGAPRSIAKRARPSRDVGAGNPASFGSGNTTHFSIVDRDGNAVANTYTLNFNYGLGLVADGTGVLLNNELDDFTVKPGVPNAFGLVGGPANAPAPGKRPLSSMTPTIVLKDGKPFLVTGSPGGSRIINAVLQVIVNAIDFRMNVADAVNAPRVHHQWLPDEAIVEPGVPPDTVRALEARGHQIAQQRRIGAAGTILVDARGPRRRRRSTHARRPRGRLLIFRNELERAMGFEPTTPTLARLCSTPELHPHPS